jgi:hypothetical protein
MNKKKKETPIVLRETVSLDFGDKGISLADLESLSFSEMVKRADSADTSQTLNIGIGYPAHLLHEENPNGQAPR